MRGLDGTTDSMDMSVGEGQGSLACCSPRGHSPSRLGDDNNNNTHPHSPAEIDFFLEEATRRVPASDSVQAETIKGFAQENGQE